MVAGFWLTGESWGPISDRLRQAGHTVHTPTLPGKRPGDYPSLSVTLRDQIDAIVELIDALDSPVILVGHSGGGAIIYGAIDARPERVARGIYVDSGPLAEGMCINDALPAQDGWLPFPGWDAFEDDDLRDMTPRVRAQVESLAVPEPARIATDPIHLSNPARRHVPASVICCEFPASVMRELMASGHPYGAELARCPQVDLLDLTTGHWPQFTRPNDLGNLLVEVVAQAK